MDEDHLILFSREKKAERRKRGRGERGEEKGVYLLLDFRGKEKEGTKGKKGGARLLLPLLSEEGKAKEGEETWASTPFSLNPCEEKKKKEVRRKKKEAEILYTFFLLSFLMGERVL